MKRILASVVATGILGLAAPALATTARPIGTVIIWNGPGTNYAVVAAMPEGESASVIGHDGRWLKVQTSGGHIGYMADWATREVFDDQYYFVKVNTDVLNVRQAPGVDGRILGQVKQGQQLRALEGLGGWYKVEVPDLGTGWVSGEFLSGAAAGPGPVPVPVPPPGPGPAPVPVPAPAPAPAPAPVPAPVPQPPATQPPNTPPPDPPVVQAPRSGLAKAVGAAVATAMYDGRARDYDRVAWVRAGQPLTYIDSAEGWIKVANADGATGWVDGTEVYIWDRNMPYSHQASYGVMEGDWRMHYQKVREVVPGAAALPLRSGPTAGAAVKRTLRSGDQVKLRYVGAGEYVQVTLDDGDVGWLSRNWLMPVAGVPQESVRLYQVGPGFVRLELSNQAARADVQISGRYLQLSLPENPGRLSGLTIQQNGVAEMTMDRNSLTLRFDGPVQYQVVEQSDQRTVVDIRPVVIKVQPIPGADRQTYRLFVDGSVAPSARREGASVVLDLPGARLQGGAAAPAGLTLDQGATGLTARVTTSQQYAIKRGPGYLDLVIYQPGLAGKLIVVDPGHGGSEIGAIGPTGLQEQHANLAIAWKLRDWLQAAGATVVMTRTGDTRCATPQQLAPIPFSQQLRYDLNCRAQTANTRSADLFLSIHGNANPSRAEQGTETYYSAMNFNVAQSRLLAQYVQAQVPPALDTRNRGVKLADFYVIKYTDAPAVLVETAFLSNPWEEKMLKLDDYRAKAAAAVFRGIQRFFQ